MKRRLFTFFVAVLMTFICIVPAVAYTPKVRAFNVNDCTDISASPIMSYGETIRYMVQRKNITYREAVQLFPEPTGAREGSYRILSVTLTVEQQPSYHPTLELYCEVSVGDGVWGIVRIVNAQINGSSNTMSKQFSGDVEVWLEGPERIQYIVNGDFYTLTSASKIKQFGYCYNSGIKRFT